MDVKVVTMLPLLTPFGYLIVACDAVFDALIGFKHLLENIIIGPAACCVHTFILTKQRFALPSQAGSGPFIRMHHFHFQMFFR